MSFVNNFGSKCAQQGLSWEETETLFNAILDAGEATRAQGCNCKMELLVDLSTGLFRFEHYTDCTLHA